MEVAEYDFPHVLPHPNSPELPVALGNPGTPQKPQKVSMRASLAGLHLTLPRNPPESPGPPDSPNEGRDLACVERFVTFTSELNV